MTIMVDLMRKYTEILYRKIFAMLEKGTTPKEIAKRLVISRSLVYVAKLRFRKLKTSSDSGASPL